VGDVTVDPRTLEDVSVQWGETEQRLTEASGNLSGVATSGFSPDVASAARTFLTTWSEHVTGAAERAQTVAENLDAGRRAYIMVDVMAQGTFQRWLVETP